MIKKENSRKQFFDKLEKRMAKNKNIWLLYIDLGYFFIEKIQKRFPDRCINTGCIEQCAIGIGCGLALAGKKVYIYSASTFLIFRALEQIRNDIGYQGLDVTLVGHAGISYNFLGHTHLPQNNEDIKVLKAIGKKIKYIKLT